jgi:hypothetical protein
MIRFASDVSGVEGMAQIGIIRSAIARSRQTTPSSVLLATESILHRVGLPFGFF